jgi:hypothetical protein
VACRLVFDCTPQHSFSASHRTANASASRSMSSITSATAALQRYRP